MLNEPDKRKQYKDLPIAGTSAEMILARDQLASNLSALYLPDVAKELIDLLEGTLGFVDDPEVGSFYWTDLALEIVNCGQQERNSV